MRRAATMLLRARPAPALAFAATPARADLKLCNSTASRVGVSIGYQDPQGWTTEGWWNIASQTCETLLKGAVPSRFIYVHAVDYDRGGEWIGTNFMCTHDKSFAIRVSRTARSGATSAPGFFEVDTGEAKEWTIRLTDPDEGPKAQDPMRRHRKVKIVATLGPASPRPRRSSACSRPASTCSAST